MSTIIRSAWPLFFGIAMVMMGTGLQGTLLGIRATIEGFSTPLTGLIMSFYYGGFLAGSILAPKLVQSVGHIRVFTALASLASTTALLHGLFVDPVVWVLARVIAGFCIAGLYIVVESWLNDLSTNENRGKILGVYLLTFYGAMVVGQYMLFLAAPEGIELFILISILISLALLPISLSKRPAPDFEAPKPTGIREVYAASPLGVVGVILSGIGGGVIFGMAPVYAMQTGMEINEIAHFMAVFVLGGMCAQLPIGLLSDRISRRMMIVIIAAATCVTAVICFLAADHTGWLYIAFFLMGGAALSIYGLCVAYTNDHLEREQFVGASATLILVNGGSAFSGPFIASLFMGLFGPASFFLLVGLVYSGIVLFAFHRSRMRPAVPVSDQSHFVSMPIRGTTISAQIAEETAPAAATESATVAAAPPTDARKPDKPAGTP